MVYQNSTRFFARALIVTVFLYLVSRFFIFWHDWPDFNEIYQGFTSSETTLEGNRFYQAIATIMLYLSAFVLIFISVKSSTASLTDDAKTYQNFSYFIIRAAFWSVFLIGIFDATISLLRVEEVLVPLVGEDITKIFDQTTKRGPYVHYPLMVVGIVIASFSRSLGFIWLAFLVVLSEFAIVITRFIFSYEQAWMGDLVRFWYAAFFLFASAYTLVENGHVRVDVLYSQVKNKKKAWINALGSLFLGLPVCWTILYYGMGTKQSSLIAPILSFESSPNGYGMYVKYLMAAFLIVFAVSMAMVFISYFLKSCAYIFEEQDAERPTGGEH